MSMIGHNSEAFGETTCDDTLAISDDHKKLFHYVQWNLADYITGTQGMTPDQEGIYMRFLVRLYDRGQAFQDDDKKMSLLMGLDIRKWRRIKGELVGIGKVVIKNGSLTNSRFERERVKRAQELRKQAAATKKYWEDKRAKQRTSEELRADFDQTSDELREEVGAKFDKKPNENNGRSQHPTSYTRKSRVQSLDKERKKENKQPPNSESVAARGAGEVQGLNGATAHIVKTLGEWINPIIPDHKTAKGWLESSVSMYGGTVVRDSFAELEAKIMHGDIVGRPIPLLTKICQRRKSASTPPKKPNNSRRPRPWD